MLADNAVIRGNTVQYNHVTTPPSVGLPIENGIFTVSSDAPIVSRNVVRSPSSAGITTPSLQQGIDVDGAADAVVRLNRVINVNNGMRVELFAGQRDRGKSDRQLASTGFRVFGRIRWLERTRQLRPR